MNLAPVAAAVGRRPEHLFPVRAERATIGLGIVRGAVAVTALRGMLRADDYADPQSRVAFEALARLDDAGAIKLDGVSLLALWDSIQASGSARQFPGGPEQLHAVFLRDEPAFGGEDGVRQAAKIVGRASMFRHAQARAEQVIRSIQGADGLADDLDGRVLIDAAATDLADIASRALSDESTIHISLVCDEHDRLMESRLDGTAPIMSYGIRALDWKTDGADCNEGELVVIAARPSMGKTAVFGSIVRGQYVRRINYRTPAICDPHHWMRLWKPIDDPRPMLIASAEMTEVKLLDRQCGDLCSINTLRIQRPIRHNAPEENADRENWKRIAPHVRDAKTFIRTWPVDYVSTPKVLEEIERQARAWRREHKVIAYDWSGKPIHEPAGLVVDHLGCLRMMAGRPSGESEVNYIGRIVQRLKDLAKELKIVVYLLVQLNRLVTQRSGGDNIPQLSDMRDSGKIEEIADTVIMLHRPVYYASGDNSEDELWERYNRLRERGASERELVAVESEVTHMDAIFRKARNGATGSVPLGFYRTFTRVTDKVIIREAA